MSKTPSDAAASKPAAAKSTSAKSSQAKSTSAKLIAAKSKPNVAKSNPAAPAEAAAAAAGGRSLEWAVRLLYAEAIFTGLVALVTIWLAVAADNVSVQSAIATPVIAVLLGLIWTGLGTTLRRRKPWARGPAIVLEMLLIPIGYYMIDGGIAWLGVPVMVVGLFGSGLLLAPSTREALGI